jgi:hypothetical protein
MVKVAIMKKPAAVKRQEIDETSECETPMRRPASATEATETDDGKAPKGLALLAHVGKGEAMGRNAAQSIMDRLKALKKEDPNHNGLDHYKKCKTQDAKRSFGLRLHLDRDGAFCRAREYHTFGLENKSKTLTGKLALWGISKIEGLVWNPNCAVTMSILADIVDGLDSEPHYRSKLADEGWLVYDFSKRMADTVSAKRSSGTNVEVQRTIDADVNEYIDDAKTAFDESFHENRAHQGQTLVIGDEDKKKRKLALTDEREEKKLKMANAKQEKEDKTLDAMSQTERRDYVLAREKTEFLQRCARVLGIVSKAENDSDKAAVTLAKLMSEKKVEFISDKLAKQLSSTYKEMATLRESCNRVIGEVELMDPKLFDKHKIKFLHKIDHAELAVDKFTKPGEGLYAKFKAALAMKK